jgi:hypothetical protein
MLNLPETQRTTHLWQRVGPALFGEAGEKHPIFREGLEIVYDVSY